MVKKKVWRRKYPDYYQLALFLHAIVFAYLTYYGWARLAMALSDQTLLRGLGVFPGAGYLIASGAVWIIMGLAAIGLLLVRHPAARLAVVGLALFFGMTYWFDRLIFTRSSVALENWPFALAGTLFLLAFNISLMAGLQRWETTYGRWRRSRNRS